MATPPGMTYSNLRHRASKAPFHGAALIAAVVLASWDTHAARPRYGGTVRIAVQPTIRSLDPAAQPAGGGEASIRDVILPLLFETLVAIDTERGVQPGLAAGWDQDASATRWRFMLRGGVALHDGSTLDAARVATSLSARRGDWQVAAAGTAVTIDTGQPRPDLLWELADVRSAIAVRSPAGELIGTGPFRAERLESSRLLLRAHDSYWGSRPFLDQVRIEFGRSLTNQLTDLETGRADIVSARPTDDGSRNASCACVCHGQSSCSPSCSSRTARRPSIGRCGARWPRQSIASRCRASCSRDMPSRPMDCCQHG